MNKEVTAAGCGMGDQARREQALRHAALHPDVAIAIELYERLDGTRLQVEIEHDNAAYGAAISTRETSPHGRVRFRAAKLTPKKAGLFVTLWQRAEDGTTRPLTGNGDMQSLVVTAREGDHFGLFIFPAMALVEHAIVATDSGGGKRGFRVYPPWSTTTNRQAKRTQQWQCEYFRDRSDDRASSILERI